MFTYYIRKHMDAVDSDFFHFCISHLVNIAIIAKGRVGLESDPWLVSHKLCFSLLNGEYDFEPGPLGLVRKRRKQGMREDLRPNRARLKVFVVWSSFFWHSSKLLSCIGRNLFEAEVGPIHCYLLASLFRRIKAKPTGNKNRQRGRQR